MSQYNQGGNAGADTAEQAEERRDADRRMSPAQDEGDWQWQNQLLNGNERRNDHRRQVDNTQTD
ncbi:hypothetical protein QWZ03_01755 [Chitinimonas viridis]|uniref:Uncharacterized protein n=1 Tax=Chitinimonas viridis TaxID=664880 RepID=A0ABT8B197_9NEIS|nr:hypothetical protein [Chitinimonas viridis]MDN3575495.1 hypothetical protein [Chitinimonas viridis]